MKLNVCVVAPFNRPNENASMVIFRNAVGFVPVENSDTFLEGCSRYAKKHKIILVSCIFEYEDFLCVAVIDSKGEALGISRACYLRLDVPKNIKQFDNIEIINTQFGKLFVAVDADISNPEIIRYAILEGCEFMISQQYYNPVDYHLSRLLMGAWNGAVSNCVHIISVTNITSGIFAPLEITSSKDGLLLFDETDSDFYASFEIERTTDARKELIEKLVQSPIMKKHINTLSR